MENRPFFNPYLFGPNQNLPPNIQLPPNMTPGGFFQPEFTPKDFYENQYIYYRYLNEYLDYTLKRAELDRINNVNQAKPNGN